MLENKFKTKYQTKSSRFKNWDYSLPSNYFITICTLNRNNFFGKIENQIMEFSTKGQIALIELQKTIKLHQNLTIDPWVIMPNHLHLLISFRNLLVQTHRGASLHDNSRPSIITHSHSNHPNFYQRINQKSNQTIPNLIKQFKSAVKRQCQNQNLFFAWQPNYFDIIIDNQKQLQTIKNYIQNNPINYQKDKLLIN
jgi:REP element-mobilizing transposase RayT